MTRRERLVRRCSSRARQLAPWVLFAAAAASGWGIIQATEVGRAGSQALRTVESEEQIKQLVVMLQGTLAEQSFNGAGIIVGRTSERLYIATAHHVVRQGTQQAERLEAQFRWLPGEWKKASVLANGDTELDLAVLAVDARELSIPDLSWGALGDLKALKPGGKVFPIGFPNAIEWFRPQQPHTLHNVTERHIRTEGQVFPGNSGGALVTEDWRLVGLVSSVSSVLGASFRIDVILDRLREWRYPVGLTSAASDAHVPSPPTAPAPAAETEAAAEPNQAIYAINPNHDLLWYQHAGREDGSYRWVGPKTVGNGWTFRQVFSGGDGVLYAISPGGELLWFRHDGHADGSARWAAMEGKVVGVGWNVRHVFSGGGGVIYAINSNGDLVWNRHDGRLDGSFRWAAPAGTTVGTGWIFKQVFSAGGGVIYAISSSDQLLWYRHDGYVDGSARWAAGEGKVVGVGWNVLGAFSGSGGVIYAITANRDLLWNRHDGREDGSYRWAAPEGKTVGNGWTFKHVFSGASL